MWFKKKTAAFEEIAANNTLYMRLIEEDIQGLNQLKEAIDEKIEKLNKKKIAFLNKHELHWKGLHQ